MPGDDPFAFAAAAEPKPVKKHHHWRDKLFSKDKEDKVKSTDQQVEDFLGSTRPKPAPQGQSGKVPAPRIDVSVSQRWPSSHDVASASPSSPPSAHDAFPPAASSISPPKRRARKGLRVKFSDQEPEVIGEGGEEADAPTMEISLARGRSRGQQDNTPRTGLPELRLDTSISEPAESDERAEDDWKPLLMQNIQDADFLMVLNSGQRGSRLSLRLSSDPNSLARRFQAKMRAEEGRALQNRFTEDPSSPTDEGSQLQQQQNSLPLRPSGASERFQSLDAKVDEVSQAPSHGASPVPTISEQSKTARLDPGVPSTTAPGGATQSMPNDHAGDKQRPSSRDSREATTPSPQPFKKSLRSVASAVGDNAFAEFTAYVERFSSLFRLAAESVKPMMETSLSEWIRAATWWFLKGRSTLEASLRSKPSASGGNGKQAARTRQAVIDLGKAWWINHHIVPQHPELARYGKMAIDAMLAVANTAGDQRLAGLLGLHQAIMNHMRALTLSMKRNNVLSAIAPQQELTDQQTDTSMWVKYPFFTPDVSTVLSGATTKSMLANKSVKNHNTADMMPLGDSSRYFSYGSMFVDVYLSSEDDDSQQYSIPCVLSILRERTDWYVLAAIASQSELVNIMIQGDKNQGPTWDDVDWQVKSFSMRVKLPRGFELNVVFDEGDFKVIWNIVKYTLKTEASLQPEAGETLLFENTLKVFQYIDPGTPKAFPAEPSERCRIRLFEKSVTISEGTGKRNAHRGFRLSVVTSPKVKTLSSVRHFLGNGAPIVYGYLRGEDGAPALLLNVNEEGRNRSMVMTFNELEERTTMHSHLLGLVASDKEFKIPDLPVKSFTIEQPPDRLGGGLPVTHLQFPAGTVSVIDQEPIFVEHGYGPTILSEHLRVLVTTDWGSVTDRINLGMARMLYKISLSFWLTQIQDPESSRLAWRSARIRFSMCIGRDRKT